MDALIPSGCVGFLECELEDKLEGPKANIILSRILRSAVVSGAFDRRLLVEIDAGRTLHHLGGSVFVTPAAQVLT